jgi:hypothetical protein
MIFQLAGHGWPLNGGATLIPEGTRIDTSLPEWDWLKGQIPPPNSQAIDQEAYDALVKYYPANIVLSGPGIDRHGDPLG